MLRRTNLIRSALCLGLVWMAGFGSHLFAHPGHGIDGDDYSLRHYTTEPVHLVVPALVVVAIAVIAGVVVWKARSQNRQQ